tara:strand:+ start:10226 stop:10681 length:456 start_codon:yes stop_codon:yes gene_type:complete
MTKKRKLGTPSKKVDISTDLKWGLKEEPKVMRALESIFPNWPPFKKLGKYDHFDYCSWTEDCCCFVEIKSRRNTHDAYEETIIPSKKVRKALRLINLGHKAILAIKFTDGIFYVDLENALIRFGFNARTNRGAVELNHYAFIPVHQFERIA